VIGKIIFGVFKGFEHVALAFNETTDNQPWLGSIGFTCLVVQAFLFKDISFHASFHSLPLMRPSYLACLVAVINKFSAKESTCCSVLPHVNSSLFSPSNTRHAR
jgi:hypothetical protein